MRFKLLPEVYTDFVIGSDTHFFHDRIIGICGRPFRDADEMCESLIRNWNAVVPKTGQVFVLGDIFWRRGQAPFRNPKEIMDRLNGRKWLVAGNHDLFTREDYLEMGFEDARDYLELSVNHQDVVLRDMREACSEGKTLCDFFGTSPEILQIPEWPSRMEPKGFFREFSCSLAGFQSRHAPGLNQSFRWDVQRVAFELWLNVFREKWGIAADPDDLEDYGAEGCVEDFREKYPGKAEASEPSYRKALEDAQVRIAWGLATADFRKIRAFVDGRISHPAIGTREIGRTGWETTCGTGLDGMRVCLRDARMPAGCGKALDGSHKKTES